jgi:RNA polymerase rpb2, domain 6
MATLIEKLVPLRLMKTKLRYPVDPKDRYKGSVVFLLTKSIDGSIDFLNNNQFLINNKTFLSYYIEKDYTFYLESTEESRDHMVDAVLESSMGESDTHYNNIYMKLDSATSFYPDAAQLISMNEDFGINQNYPNIFRRFLYNERIKNQKEAMDIYKKIKSSVEWIKYTYINIPIYKKKNLILDWSYYANLFFKNNQLYIRDKGIDLLHHMMTRYLNDSRLTNAGYSRKTVIVPIEEWCKDIDDKILFDFTKNINPFSMIFRITKLKKMFPNEWEGIDFLICSKNAYFKVDLNNFGIKELVKFVYLTKKLIVNDTNDADATDDEETTITSGLTQNKEPSGKTTEYVTVTTSDDEKEEKVVDVAPEHKEPIVNPDEDWLKSVVADLDEGTTDTIKINDARRKRMEELDKAYDDTKIHGKKVKTILENYYTKDRSLKSEPIPIDSINEEWKSVSSLDLEKSYDIDEDIIAIFKSFRYKSRPLSIVSMKMEDTSTYMDYINTITVVFEDMFGTRSTIKLDIPKFINHRFMKLRGNLKTIAGQLILMPIIKTDENTAQIVTSYHKIFIYRINPSNGSKSTKGVSKLTKALGKINTIQTKVVVFEGDNSFICSKYDLPIEYRDLAGLYSRIDLPDGSYVLFDYDKALKLPVDNKYDANKHIIFGFDNKTKKAVYADKISLAFDIGNFIASKDKAFAELYISTTPSNKLSYSEASIMNTDIPIIVLMTFSEGLQKAMDKSKIKYRFSEKRPKATDTESVIRFSDGYIIYNDERPEDSLLMTGLTKCELSSYSIKDINNKSMWLDMLDNFGGRIKADGLDNFYDCEFDPMSIDICKRKNIPYDYIEALAYANKLLASTEYNQHTDISGNRIRTNEVLAGYLYQVLANAYGDYASKTKRVGKGVKITIKQSALIDAVMKDPGFSDLSVSSPLLEAESATSASFKGLSGMNADRAYTLDKRVYDESMLGVLGTTTGFAGNVGINRPMTINASIQNSRGLIESKKPKDLNTLNALTIYEALTPYATTHDDPIRSAMGFVQTVKHQMRVKSSSPSLITYGMDEAIPYFTTNIFSHKFRGVKGKVLDVSDDFIIYESIDESGNKTKEFVDLSDKTMKNSDGGFYVTVKLKPQVKKGQTLKKNDILAYDPTSYSKPIAGDKNTQNISYNAGTLAKIAIMCTDEAYEDSSIINTRIVDAMTSFYVVEKLCSLDAQSNVFSVAEVGKEIQEGAPLIIFQNAFEDEDANKLLKNINDEELDLITDFGRIQVRSKLTGVLQDIKIKRTCELSDLSPSLRKIVTQYENGIKAKKKKLLSAGVNPIEVESMLDVTEKMNPEGKLKNTPNGVLFEFYIKCRDKMGVGDKLTYNTAIKGVIKDIIPEGKDPYTDFRKDEPIDALLTSASVNARMTPSVMITGSLNKVLIELSRQCKEKLGIKWTNLENKNNLD